MSQRYATLSRLLWTSEGVTARTGGPVDHHPDLVGTRDEA